MVGSLSDIRSAAAAKGGHSYLFGRYSEIPALSNDTRNSPQMDCSTRICRIRNANTKRAPTDGFLLSGNALRRSRIVGDVAALLRPVRALCANVANGGRRRN